MSYPNAESQSESYSRSDRITTISSINTQSRPATSPQQQHSPPVSSTMIRKRTLQDMVSAPQHPSFTSENAQSSSSSSPMSSVPSFDFDNVNRIGTSSPFSTTTTIESSPMIVSRSTSTDLSYDASKVKVDSEDETDIALVEAPEMKRRKTADSGLLTPLKVDRRGNGKDGQDVWPTDVETSFHDALRIIPKLGRKKIMVNGKPCGRNELIADYIRRKTGKTRSRKQVSSHIQVLKNMRKNDAAFMALVADPTEGEDCFTPESAIAFFGRNLPTLAPQVISSPMATSYCDAGLLSPYTPSPFIPTQRSLSCGSLSPSQYDRSNTHSPLASSRPMSATSSITTAMKEMHFPIPSPRPRTPILCPIAPAAFKIWADDSQTTSKSHVFARLDNASLAGPSTRVFLDDLPSSEKRFPGLVSMSDHLPCQFLHVKINLDIPDSRSPDFSPEKLKTQLILTSLQDLNLTSVTSIYSCGVQVLSLEEQLASPNRLNNRATSAESSPDSTSPMTPTDSSSSPINPLQHKYSYSAPFASAFWSVFLAGSFSRAADTTPHRSTFIKIGDERPEIALAVSGLTVIQEFVVRPEEQSVPLVDGINLSPGSALGDVVLVITYDFECLESFTCGTASASYLSVRRPPAPVIRMQSEFLPNRSSPVNTFPSDYPTASSIGILSPRPTHSNKPSLTLNIPPPPTFNSSTTSSSSTSSTPYGSNPPSASTITGGPITPWPQVMHTPNMPPPPSISSPSQRERLEQIWARDSNEWELNSPALMGAFSPLQQQSSSLPPRTYSQIIHEQPHHYSHLQQQHSVQQHHQHHQSHFSHSQSSHHSHSHSHSHRQRSNSPPSNSHHQHHHQRETPYIHPAHGIDGLLTYAKPEEEVEGGGLVDDRSYFNSAPISRYSSQYSN